MPAIDCRRHGFLGLKCIKNIQRPGWHNLQVMFPDVTDALTPRNKAYYVWID